jgi:hypothetical protein
MASDAEWGFMSEGQEVFIRDLRVAATEAVSNGTRMRLVLKSGELYHGVPDRIQVDASNSPTFFNTPLAPEDRDRFGPNEIVIQIAGTEILAQEVESFSVGVP